MKMKQLGVGLLLTVAVNMTTLAQAQPPVPPVSEGGRGEGRPGGPGGPGGRVTPLQAALDTNKDGEISAEELAASPAALKKLDANNDSKLTADEMRLKPQPVAVPPSELVDRLMEFDRNKDGKLTKAELPKRMQSFLIQADTNKDGVLTQEELLAISTKQEAARQEAEKKAMAAQAAAPAPAGEPGRGAGGRGEGGRGEGRPGGPGGPGGRVTPLQAALDTDKDGTISAEEIAAAATALKTLDKDGDGKISAEEMRPAMRGPEGEFRGEGGRGGEGRGEAHP